MPGLLDNGALDSPRMIKEPPAYPNKGASIFGTAANLQATMIGSGVLALPFSIGLAGSVLGPSLMMVAALITYYCFCELSHAARNCGYYTFKGISQAVFGRHGVIPVAIAVFLSSFGAGCNYVIISGDLITQFLHHITDKIPKWLTPNIARCFIVGCIMGPLSLCRKVSYFTIVSFVALASVVYTMGIVIYYFIMAAKAGELRHVSLANWDMKALMAVPVFVLSYGGAQVVPSLLSEIRGRNTNAMNRACLIATISCSVCYLTIGLLGLFQCKGEVPDNILMALPDTLPANICLCCFFLVVCACYPIVLYSNYRVVYEVIDYIREEHRLRKNRRRHGASQIQSPPVLGDSPVGDEAASVGEHSTDDALNDSASEHEVLLPETDATQPPSDHIWYGWGWHILIATCEAGLILLVAMLVPSLSKVSGIIGAVAGVPIYFMFPIIFNLLARNYPWSLPQALRRATHFFTEESGYRELTPEAEEALPVIHKPDHRYACPRDMDARTSVGRFFKWYFRPTNIIPALILTICPVISVIGVVSTLI